ncbi:hypothetical protein AwErysi_00740 [Erysipelotrichaceae bacterium]|nr:hypothetical protein AwErysi_00740 [Erysipelotrichaceae bacterium]
METVISRGKNRRNRKNKKKKKLIILFTILIILIAVISASVVGGYQYYFVNPVEQTYESEVQIFELETRETVRNIASELAEAGIIKADWPMILEAKKRKIEYVSKAGKYSFSKAMTISRILDIIEKSETAYDIQIPISDGTTIDGLLETFSRHEGEKNALDAEINDLAYIGKLREQFSFLPAEIEGEGFRHRLEGFLGNDTYFLKDDDTIQVLIEKALSKFESEYNDAKLGQKLISSNKTLFEVVTMASVVRGEVLSGDIENQKLVAGVFYNRAEADMPFGSDVTVGYSLGINDVNYTQEELDNPSPYNTYVHPGLPLGPINNPGFDVIEAALNPTDSKYYYFLADICNDGHGEFGKIYYAEDYRQHNIYRDEYLGCIS